MSCEQEQSVLRTGGTSRYCTISLHYVGSQPIDIHGPVTGYFYHFFHPFRRLCQSIQRECDRYAVKSAVQVGPVRYAAFDPLLNAALKRCAPHDSSPVPAGSVRRGLRAQCYTGVLLVRRSRFCNFIRSMPSTLRTRVQEISAHRTILFLIFQRYLI